MTIASEFVSQGIVFISIMAGFAFVISAEILMKDPVPEKLRDTAFRFALSSILFLITALAGVTYFLVSTNGDYRNSLGVFLVLSWTVRIFPDVLLFPD